MEMDSRPPTNPQCADSHGAGNFPSIQGTAPTPPGPTPAPATLPLHPGKEAAVWVQDPAPPPPRPAQAPPPARQRGDGTHGLTIPSRGAVLPRGSRGPRGSLWSGNRLSLVALYGWACRTLGADGAGGALSAGLSLLPLQASLRTKRRGYRLGGEVHTHSPASLAWPRSPRGHRQAQWTGKGTCRLDMLVDTHGELPRWGGHQQRSASHHPPCPQALTGGLPSRGCPVLLETPSAGTRWDTEGRREPRAPPGSPGSRTPGSGVPRSRTPGIRVPGNRSGALAALGALWFWVKDASPLPCCSQGSKHSCPTC